MTTVERIMAIEMMHQNIIDLGDEELYGRWIYLVPDEADINDFIDIAEDEEFFKECERLYFELMDEGL
jgi:hypothetical protein